MSDNTTICRACGRAIEHGQLILEPDFTFATGLHQECGAACLDVDNEAAQIIERQG